MATARYSDAPKAGKIDLIITKSVSRFARNIVDCVTIVRMLNAMRPPVGIKNMGDRTQHRWKGLHDPIISRDDFIAVQQLINNAKYGNKGILPELQVIKEGALKGFVPIHPRWSGFREEHYINACMSAFDDDETIDFPGEQQIVAQGGDFDFRGFEIARSQFFDVKNKPSATI